jgi:hypothetical protein
MCRVRGTRSFMWENLKGINQFQELYTETGYEDVYWIEQAQI